MKKKVYIIHKRRNGKNIIKNGGGTGLKAPGPGKSGSGSLICLLQAIPGEIFPHNH